MAHTCKTCQRTFTRRGDVLRHQREIHPQPGQEKPRHTCETCQSTFTRRDNMLRHQRVDHPKPGQVVQSYSCGKCNRSFKWPWNLKQHERLVHGGEVGEPPRKRRRGVEDEVTSPRHSDLPPLHDFVEEAIAPFVDTIETSDRGPEVTYRALRPLIVKRLLRLYFQHKQRGHNLDRTLFDKDLENTASKLRELFSMNEDASLWHAIKMKRYDFEELIPEEYPDA